MVRNLLVLGNCSLDFYGCHCILVDEKYNISDLLPFFMDLMDFNSERNSIFWMSIVISIVV